MVDLLSPIDRTPLIVVTSTYVVFLMDADDDDGSGIVALFGIAREAGPDPKLRCAMVIAGMAGAALSFGDGLITSAVSVLSAVEGLDTASKAVHLYADGGFARGVPLCPGHAHFPPRGPAADSRPDPRRP